MTAKSSPFSCWHLSGKDADEFMRHFNDPTPNIHAINAYQRGKILADEYSKNGFVVLNPKKRIVV